MFKPFTFLFYKGNSLISKIIRVISKGKYSHVCLILDDLHTIECSWCHPVVIKHFKYKSKSYDVYRLNIDLTDEQKEIIFNFIKQNIDSGYDWKFIISRGLHLLFGTKVVNSKKRYNCDELIVDAF